MNNKNILNIKTMALISMFTAMICVCSWIAVPNPFAPGVSFTLQTFAIILSGLLLSPAQAFICIVVYLMLGLINLPVFQNFTTLYSKIGAPSGGYIIGFILAPILISAARMFFEKQFAKITNHAQRKTATIAIYIVLAVILGIVIIDIPGVIQYKIVTGVTWDIAIIGGALSFMVTDVIKCVLAAVTAFALKEPMKRFCV